MSKVAIVSDSNSGITQLQAEELGITILPMPFFVGDKTLYEDIDLSQKEFYQMLSENANISTSMPLVGFRRASEASPGLCLEALPQDLAKSVPSPASLSQTRQTVCTEAPDPGPSLR